MHVVLVLLLTSPALCDKFLLGYLTGSQRRPGDREYQRPGLTISGAISLAIEEVNSGQLGSLGHSLDLVVAETYGEETSSIRQVAALWTRNVSVYIGPQETCVHEGRMAAAFNLPIISYYCTNYETTDKRHFPTFARTRPPDTQISKSVASVLLAFNWTQVTFLYFKSEENEVFTKIASTILTVLESSGVKVLFTKTWSTPYHHKYSENPFHTLVQQTYRDSRIYLILGHTYEHIGLIVAMEELKLFDNGEYWVVGADIEQYDGDAPEKYLGGLLRDQSDPVAVRGFRSYLGVVPSSPRGYDNFSLLVNAYMERPPFNFPNPVDMVGGVKRITAVAAYLYDAVQLYAKAVLEILEEGGNPYNGTNVINHIKGRHYHSAMGYMVYMDENGDAAGNYTIIGRRPHHLTPGEFGLYPVGLFTLAGTTPEVKLTEELDWGPRGCPPIAEPPCGFRGEKCITHTMEILGGVVGGVLAIMTIVLLLLYRNWRYEQELDSLLWKVDYKDIQMNDEQSNKINRASHPLIRTSQVSLSSNPDADFRYSSIYCQIGVYRGRVLAVKTVHKKTVDITRTMKKELKTLRDLRHDNLNAFIGACTEPPHICIVTEYCTRGSLKDILENEDVKLDNMFIASLVADIIRGLIYLQDSPLHYHGNLKSSNCLVDSRWVVKLADFGLSQLKGDEETHHHYLQHTFYTPQDETVQCKWLLYRAPELLRINTASPGPGSQKGDVYSFGIILYELHSRKGPFGDTTGLSTAETLRRVIHYSGQGPPFRPPLELLENSFDFVRDLLKECWQESPDDRPEIKTVRAKLRPMRKGMKPNIFDNMIAMMEKYANNLEALVDERTDQLVEEKKKTEALLYEMLPRYVAEQLKRGHKVQAESFDCVTIYFSDIVGFTQMSAESTPLQVVDFLNDLYTCFDSTIENFDVYKVETIGDAYMVVSGLPVRNGDQHAGEIATMSLHLLEAVRRFHIRHRPNDSLQLRIGIHSGPVCAGVVGLKMPRYCLFGDTVNTASRMESTGTALKIHCSSACKSLLDRLKGYKLLERGTVDMKGKGEMLTYWLVGEEHEHQIRRTEEREKRRAEQLSRHSTKKSLKNHDSNGCVGVPRSSLKNRNLTLTPSPRNLSRCASLESPKKLRFASNHTLEFTNPNPYQRCSRDPLLEVIKDNSPSKRTLSQSGSDMGDNYCLNHLSASCPCIENFSPPSSQLLPLTAGEGSSTSEPTLCASAPVSPSDVESPLVLSVTRSPSDEVHTPLLPSYELRAH
ncbi:guanylate cyclase 32E [Macrosteles quadrilineatus]|uniref:guanylate cyclase 32E n=1 Tax=Macrosteles quadrilineatus TaxID=74068 RepID=UPI0023E09009|nr:guanylate cyclase 32E [Macrosteles quadrilineatus]